MLHTHKQSVRSWLITGFIVGASLTLWNCSGNKKEADTATTAGDSSVFGRQGDTANANLEAPQQAPPDSGSRGAVVPAGITVKPKKTD